MIPVSDLIALRPADQETYLTDIARALYNGGDNVLAKCYLRASFAATDPPGRFAN